MGHFTSVQPSGFCSPRVLSAVFKSYKIMALARSRSSWSSGPRADGTDPWPSICILLDHKVPGRFQLSTSGPRLWRRKCANMIRIPLVKAGQIALLTCSIIFAVIPTVAVFLRLLARRIANRKLDAGDYLIVFAWVGYLCFLSKTFSFGRDEIADGCHSS